MKKAAIFLDGMTTGTRLDNQICVNAKLQGNEVQLIKEAMEKVGVTVDRNGYEYQVVGPYSTSMTLSLRKRNSSKAHYLNLSGNPLTFLRPNNLSGYANPRRMIARTFKIAIRELQNQAGIALPSRLQSVINKGLINVHSLEFAAYTKPLDKRRYLSTLQHVFGYGVRGAKGRKSVLSALGLRVTQNYDGTSL